MSVSEAQQRISSIEFSNWIAYNKISPIDIRDRLDYWGSLTVAAIRNQWLGKNDRAIEPVDLLPHYEKPQRSPEEIELELTQWARVYNRQVNK